MIHAFIIGAILFAFGQYQLKGFPKWSFYGAFLISAISTIFLGYYFIVEVQAGDTLSYFQSAVKFNSTYTKSISYYLMSLLHAEIPEHQSNWHSVFFVKLISPIVYLANGSYWLTGLYLTLLSFLLRWTAMRYLSVALDRKWLVYLSVFFLPGVSAWSGGVFKEAVANGLFLLLVSIAYYRIRRYHNPMVREWLFILIAGIVLYKLRFYLFGVWLAFTATFIWFRLFEKQKKTLWLGMLVMLCAVVFGAQLLHPWLRPTRLPLTFFEIYEQILSTPSETSFTFGTFMPDYWHLLLTSPIALFTGLFRPTFFDLQSWLWVPFQLEKLSLLLLAVISIWKIRISEISGSSYVAILWLTVLTISLTLVTPNFGSLIRYQSAYLPFLMILLGWFPLRKLNQIN